MSVQNKKTLGRAIRTFLLTATDQLNNAAEALGGHTVEVVKTLGQGGVRLAKTAGHVTDKGCDAIEGITDDLLS